MTVKRRKLPPYAALIERLRRKLSITQTVLARRLKVSPMSVSRWERGVQEPSSQIYVRLGTLADGEQRWQFWEYAGLKKSHVAEAKSDEPMAVSVPEGMPVPETPSALVAIPLISSRLGASMCGDYLSEGSTVEILTAPKDWVPNPQNTVCAFVDGDSMEPLIQDGSIVCVDTHDNIPSKLIGKVTVARHERLGTKLSKVTERDGRLYLTSESSSHEEVEYSPDSGWKITGRVLWWLTRSN